VGVLAPANADTTVVRNKGAEEWAKPLVMMRTFHFWVGGGPIVVVYRDGSVLYQSDRHAQPTLWFVQLRQQELSKLAREIRFDRFEKVDARYKIAHVTDMPTTQIAAWGPDDEHKAVEVYGVLDRRWKTPPNLERHFITRDKLPAPLVAIFDRLNDYTHDRAVAWHPPEMLCHFYASATPEWPKDWPPPVVGREGYRFFPLPSSAIGAVQAYNAKNRLRISCHARLPYDELWLTREELGGDARARTSGP
jgi:hypothetical protein